MFQMYHATACPTCILRATMEEVNNAEDLRDRVRAWHEEEQQKTAAQLQELRLLRKQLALEGRVLPDVQARASTSLAVEGKLALLEHKIKVRDEELACERRTLSEVRTHNYAMADEIALLRSSLAQETARRKEAERILAQLAPQSHRLARIAFGAATSARHIT